MRFDEIDMQGPFQMEKVSSLPTWSTEHRRRLILVENIENGVYNIYYGGKNEGKQLNFNVALSGDTINTEEFYNSDGTINLTGADVFMAFDGENYFFTSSLPNQNGHSGKVLQTDGNQAYGYKIKTKDILPSQQGQDSKFLQTNGTSVRGSSSPKELPAQGGNQGKVLQTDGSETSGSDISSAMGLPDKNGHGSEYLKVNSDEDSLLGDDPFPEFTGTAKKHLSNDGSTLAGEVINVIPEPTQKAVLQTDGTNIAGNPNTVIPDQTDNDGNVLGTNGTNLFGTDIRKEIQWITEDTTGYVNPDGSGDYNTLESAFDDLANWYVHPSATLTIELSSDNFILTNQLSVTKRGKAEGGITLQGQGSSSTYIKSSSSFSSGSAIISLWESTILLKDLTIEGMGTSYSVYINGIVLQNSTTYLENVVVKSHSASAIHGFGSRVGTENSIIEDSTYGIVGDFSYIAPTNTIIQNNIQMGCWCRQSSGFDLNLCSVKNHSKYAILSDTGSTFRSKQGVIENTIYKNDSWGVVAQNGGNIDLEDLEFGGALNNTQNRVSNFTYCVAVGRKSFGHISNASINVNQGKYAVVAQGISYVIAYNIGDVITSPEINTIGNINSYIEG